MSPNQVSPASANLLVVGDVMLDRYLEGVADRMSPEALVPLVRVVHTFERPGAAANLAVNAAAMGGSPMLVGVVGRDSAGERLRALVEAEGVSAETLVSVDSIPTTLKTRLLAGHQQIARFDEEKTLADPDTTATLTRLIEARLPQARWAVISDYAKGVCAAEVCRNVIEGGGRHGTKVIVDPKGVDFWKYSGAAVMTPNRSEAAAVVGFAIRDADDALRAARQIRERFTIESVVVTLGHQGMVLVGAGITAVIPTQARQIFDPTGAGDTVVAMLAVALSDGVALEEACHLANAAAGVQVSRIGTRTVTRADVMEAVQMSLAGPANKVVSVAGLAPVIRQARSEGKRVGFTNGCFDILHHGHVALLEAAAAECDVLVVGVNSDASVTRLKGPLRPIVPATGRRAMLAALSSVAWVCEFDEDTPLELIRAIEPDLLVKGADYAPHEIVGADIVLARGGRVLTLPLVPQASTTTLIERILASQRCLP